MEILGLEPVIFVEAGEIPPTGHDQVSDEPDAGHHSGEDEGDTGSENEAEEESETEDKVQDGHLDPVADSPLTARSGRLGTLQPYLPRPTSILKPVTSVSVLSSRQPRSRTDLTAAELDQTGNPESSTADRRSVEVLGQDEAMLVGLPPISTPPLPNSELEPERASGEPKSQLLTQSPGECLFLFYLLILQETKVQIEPQPH